MSAPSEAERVVVEAMAEANWDHCWRGAWSGCRDETIKNNERDRMTGVLAALRRLPPETLFAAIPHAEDAGTKWQAEYLEMARQEIAGLRARLAAAEQRIAELEQYAPAVGGGLREE